MEGGEGMVAVVRGLRDSGLAVTLLDGARQYTLMPNDGAAQFSSSRLKRDVASQQIEAQDSEPPAMCDSGAQATDGRYASMYKMAHCRITPTSPPVQLTEFPPQRAEITRGQGNFEVGGNGSGENYTPCKSNGSFRGGMSWPDRGSVCSPRPSREPDAFASSLRKYPNISAERSAEIVERLINYTQAKHSTKSYHSPQSRRAEYHTSSHTSSDGNRGSSLQESPTRDIRPSGDRYNEYNYTDGREKINPKYGNNGSKGITDNTSNSFNMEVQAAVEMVSREVATAPQTQTSRRTLSPFLRQHQVNSRNTQVKYQYKSLCQFPQKNQH